MAYDSDQRTFSIYSEDLALLGNRTITIEAFLVDYDVIVKSGTLQTDIEIIDPCLDPFDLTVGT